MNKKSFSLGVFYMMASAASLSLVGLLGKRELLSFSLSEVLFGRFFGGFILTFFLSFLLEERIRISGKLIRNNLIRSVFVLGSQYSFFYYMENHSLLNAMALLNTGPLFIPIIDRILFKNSMNLPAWVGLWICFIGVLCILQPDSFSFSFLSLIGLLAGLCQAISQTLFGAQAKEAYPVLNTCYLFLFCSLGSFIPYFFSKPIIVGFKDVDWVNAALFFFLAVVSVSNQLFRSAAYRKSSATKLSAFLYFSVLFSGILDWFVFKKNVNIFSYVGAAFIIIGGSLKTFFLMRKAKT